MNNPITGKPIKLVQQAGVKFTFKNEEFEIVYHHWLDEETGEQFTTDELDEINVKQVHDAWNAKYK